jgi:hypothetical protein
MNLVDWAVAFIKYKDAVMRRTVSIIPDKTNNCVNITLKSGAFEKYVCYDSLSNLNIGSLKDEKIVCLNKKENLDFLIKNWEAIVSTKVTVLFVNPSRSESWAVNPALHHAVTEKSALKTGLKALFDTVPEVA